MNQQELLERDINIFVEKNNIDKRSIIVKTIFTRPSKSLQTIICTICWNIIAALIYDGIQWVWTYYSHDCTPPTPPTQPAPPTPECCQICGEQLTPGKIHYCK